MRYNTNTKIIITLCFILSLNIINSNALFANPQLNRESVTTQIADYYLRSFTLVPARVPPSKTMHDTILRMDSLKLPESTQRKVILRTLFAKTELNIPTPISSILNHNAWTDLILFCGGASNPSYHFLSRINQTTTALGDCALATLLVTPISDVDTLCKRQQTIKLLLKSPSCLADLKQSLNDYRKIEHSLLSLWTYTDPLYSHTYKAYMNKRFLSSNHTTNKKAGKLNLRIFYRNFLDIYGEFIKLPAIGFFWCEASYWLTSFSKRGIFKMERATSYAPFYLFVPILSVGSVINHYNDHSPHNRSLLPFLGIAATHAFTIWRGYCGVKNYQEYSAVFSSLANRMRDVQILIQTMQKLSDIVSKYEALDGHYAPCLRAVRTLLQTKSGKTELGVMIRNLLDMKLDSWSYISSNNGKLLATYTLFTQHKDDLKEAMFELGQLDSFVGIAVLMRDSKEKFPDHCYTFTKFLDRSTQKTPYIQLDGMWYPMLNPETVVDNNIEMDANKNRNMILSGPNAGGKSCFIAGLASNLLLSQTFGIAAAKNAIITPLNKINTYIELKGDISAGSSLFMVEVERMQGYMNMLEQTRPDEFIFTISDEPLARTNPLHASAAAYSILASIAKYSNALHIVSTHYPILMHLSHKFKDRGIKNFKVAVEEKPGQKLRYTYKIVPGESNQSLALKILAQEGYDPVLLQQAEDIIQHPEKFSLLDYFKEQNEYQNQSQNKTKKRRAKSVKQTN